MALSQNKQYRIVICCISITISGLALALNTIGIYFIRRQGSQRTHQSLIILHLSIIQIPISIAYVSYWILVWIYGEEPNAGLNWTLPIWISTRVILISIIFILTADRLLAIKYSLRYMVIISKRKLNMVLIVSWASGLVIFSILKSLRSEIYVHFILVIALPIVDSVLLVFILYTYCYIILRIRRRRQAFRDSSVNTQQMQQGSGQALRVSTVIIISYVICFILPGYTDSIIRQSVKSGTLEIILLTVNMLDTCYFIALPVAYIFLHRNMRRMFMDILFRCCCRKSEVSSNANVAEIVGERAEVATKI